jgi:tRNA(Ile)-lysidine synthase
LIKERNVLILTEKEAEQKEMEYLIKEGEDIVMLPIGRFSLSEVEEIAKTASNCVYLNKEKLTFPLVLRKWNTGDIFYPFGMKGKKKISDFFNDNKLSLPEKESTWLLCSGNDIVWIVNRRADNRFAITDSSQKILKITYTV